MFIPLSFMCGITVITFFSVNRTKGFYMGRFLIVLLKMWYTSKSLLEHHLFVSHWIQSVTKILHFLCNCNGWWYFWGYHYIWQLYSCTKSEEWRIYFLTANDIQNVALQSGDVNLENVTHEDAVACLKSTNDRVVLVLGKVVAPQTNATDLAPPPLQPSQTHHHQDHTPPPREWLTLFSTFLTRFLVMILKHFVII